MSKKVSIVMLVYHHERFLRQALDSVLMQQTDFDYELIVGEDCSPDGSREILRSYEEKFGSRMVPLYRKKNLGAAGNLMDCLRRCRGDYIAMLEGDDFWTDPHKLAKQAAYLDAHPDCAAVYHNYVRVDIRGENPEKMLELKSVWDFRLEDAAQMKLPSQTGTMMFRRELNLPAGVRRRIPLYAWMPQDRTCVLLFLKCGQIAVLPDCMSAYRMYVEENGTNWTSQKEGTNKNSRLIFFLIELGMERLAAGLGLKLDLYPLRCMEYVQLHQLREWGVIGKRRELALKTVMVLLEPRKGRLLRDYRNNKKTESNPG